MKDKMGTRFDNYSYALLFALRRGKVGVRKYFCGWDTFVKLAAGNIRYCLELVEQAISMHMRDGGAYGPIPQKVQTLAAQAVGRKNLVELEGLSVHGARLTKLLLGLGRVFEIMASDTVGHAPEVNQFHLPNLYSKEVSNEEAKDCEELLNAAVMHLALLRFSGSKLGDAGETRDYDYMVHPIFSAFFVFSHRRKRKMMISPRDNPESNYPEKCNKPRNTKTYVLIGLGVLIIVGAVATAATAGGASPVEAGLIGAGAAAGL